MDAVKILDLKNDGKINMAVDGEYLYIRCLNAMYKYDAQNMRLAARNEIFKKDGKSRGFDIFGDLIFLKDFLDLYILRKDDLQMVDMVRLGENLSSDVGGVMWFDAPNVYVKIRNGKIYNLNINTKEIVRHDVTDSSFWAYCIVDDKIYAGTVKGDLAEIDKEILTVSRKISLGRMNIYNVVYRDGLLYTLSQDTNIKVVDVSSFEIAATVRNAARGMSNLLGIYNNCLVVADSGNISFWDTDGLKLREKFPFKSGWNNSGVRLFGNVLYGSDYNSIYRMEL